MQGPWEREGQRKRKRARQCAKLASSAAQLRPEAMVAKAAGKARNAQGSFLVFYWTPADVYLLFLSDPPSLPLPTAVSVQILWPRGLGTSPDPWLDGGPFTRNGGIMGAVGPKAQSYEDPYVASAATVSASSGTMARLRQIARGSISKRCDGRATAATMPVTATRETEGVEGGAEATDTTGLGTSIRVAGTAVDTTGFF